MKRFLVGLVSGGLLFGLVSIVWAHACSNNLIGDWDCSNKVDSLDVAMVLRSYGQTGGGTVPTPTRTPTPIPNIPTATPTTGTVRPTSTPASGQLPAVSESDPRITCSKYPERRIFVETQAWWMETASIGSASELPVPDGSGRVGGHTHTATCFPEDEVITASTMQFDVRLMLHKGNLGKVTWLDVGLGPGGSSIARVNFSSPLSCPNGANPAVNCEVWVPITVNTSQIPSGYQELRFRFNVTQPNGERQFASTGWQAYYRSRTGGYRSYPWLEARGWYTGTNYANARFLSPIPHAPVSGTWTFNVAMVPGASGIAVTHSAVHVDARFNLDDFGWTVTERSGPYTGSVSIDTRRLANGRHYLAIKSDQRGPNGGTNTGILQLPFFVQN